MGNHAFAVEQGRDARGDSPAKRLKIVTPVLATAIRPATIRVDVHHDDRRLCATEQTIRYHLRYIELSIVVADARTLVEVIEAGPSLERDQRKIDLGIE